MMPPRPSSLPHSRRILLPPSHRVTPFRNPSPTPDAAYSTKLNEAQVKKIFHCSEEATIEFNEGNTGQIRPGGRQSPGPKPINFVTHLFAANPDDSTQGFLYSRRHTSARFVAPITGEVELESIVDPSVSQRVKRQAQDDRGRKGRLLQMDHDVAPPTPPPKRPRRALTPGKKDKRPRPTPRPRDSLAANPPKPRDSYPPSALTSLGTSRPSSTPPVRSSSLTTPFGVRSGSALSPSLPSPVVSPGQTGKLRGRLGDGRRGTPTTSSLGSGLGGRKMSPIKVDGSRAGGVKPSLRSMTPGKLELSPHGSKGGSPGTGSRGASGNRPEGSSVGNFRGQDGPALRRNIIHTLALGPSSMQAVRSRVLGKNLSMELRDRFNDVLREVGMDTRGLYSLKKSLWVDVKSDYEGYSEAERARVRDERPSATGGKASGSGDGGDAGRMTRAQVDAGLREFDADRWEVGVVKCETDELRLRKKFQKWFPLYTGVIEELEEMGDKFRGLDRRYREARSAGERDDLARRITSSYDRYKRRRDELVKSLPQLHMKLRDTRDALEAWAKPAKVPGRRE